MPCATKSCAAEHNFSFCWKGILYSGSKKNKFFLLKTAWWFGLRCRLRVSLASVNMLMWISRCTFCQIRLRYWTAYILHVPNIWTSNIFGIYDETKWSHDPCYVCSMFNFILMQITLSFFFHHWMIHYTNYCCLTMTATTKDWLAYVHIAFLMLFSWLRVNYSLYVHKVRCEPASYVRDHIIHHLIQRLV